MSDRETPQEPMRLMGRLTLCVRRHVRSSPLRRAHRRDLESEEASHGRSHRLSEVRRESEYLRQGDWDGPGWEVH